MDPRLGIPDWLIMETFCGCLRTQCRHKREDLARRVRTEQLGALTEADVDWLLEMEWRPE